MNIEDKLDKYLDEDVDDAIGFNSQIAPLLRDGWKIKRMGGPGLSDDHIVVLSKGDETMVVTFMGPGAKVRQYLDKATDWLGDKFAKIGL